VLADLREYVERLMVGLTEASSQATEGTPELVVSENSIRSSRNTFVFVDQSAKTVVSTYSSSTLAEMPMADV
jgi:hypothetical protein